MISVHFCGKAYSGKSTIARWTGLPHINYADALKQECARLLGIDVPTLERDKARIRPLLQALGDGMRRVEPDYWLRRWDALAAPYQYTTCSDIRYANELQHSRSQGAIIIRVQVDDAVRMARAAQAGANPDDLRHANESHLDAFDVDAVMPGDLTQAAAIGMLRQIVWRCRGVAFHPLETRY